MIVELETKRLFLRPLQLTDAQETERLFPQWEIVKFLNAGFPWPWPEGLALPQYRDVILPAIERGEEWHWSLRRKDSPERLIGKISLHKNEWNNRGYWLGCHGRAKV
jgi:RimJ/RimL family protein N-acetyltransferase